MLLALIPTRSYKLGFCLCEMAISVEPELKRESHSRSKGFSQDSVLVATFSLRP